MSLARIAVAVLALAAPQSVQAQERAQPDAIVNMTFGLKFEPAEVRIRAGDTVEWRNKAFFAHAVRFDPAQATATSTVSQPEGVRPFQSGQIAGGGSWRHTFTMPGAYRYVCPTHAGEGMSGVVVVTPR